MPGETLLADPGRRPLLVDERADALRLGRLLVDLRVAVGVTQQDVAGRAGMAPRSLRRLERGERRTRASTLARLAVAIDAESPGIQQLLVEAAGCSLAPESEYRGRIEARRRRRRVAASRRFITESVVTRTSSTSGTFEVTVRRRRVGRDRVVETTTSRLVPPAPSTPGRMAS